jgi:uncharacterized damage-inducible protein DinB
VDYFRTAFNSNLAVKLQDTMKELLLQYAQYNAWANKRIIDATLKSGDGAIDKEIVSSFPSLKATVYHTWSAEFIWLQRLQLAEHPVWKESEFDGTYEEACSDWQGVSAALIQFVQKQYDDRALEHMLMYYDRKKSAHKMEVCYVLQHVFNHSTYHRGQMVTMLRHAGVTDIPGTDFITFVRKK